MRLSLMRAGEDPSGPAPAAWAGRRLVDRFLDVAARVPVRDLETLRRHFDDLDGHELADALIATAARASGAVGAAGGAAAAATWTVPPALLLSAPAQVVAETLAVAAIETKLIAELHQVYALAPAGTAAERGAAYAWAWTTRRGIDPLDAAGALAIVAGPARRAVRNRLAARAGRNLTTMAPLLSGAVIGSVANRRETVQVGRAVQADLARRAATSGRGAQRPRAASRARARRWGRRVETYQ